MPLNVQGSSSLYWATGLDNKGLRSGAKEAKGILAGFARKISAMDIFAAVSIGAIYHFKKAIKEITLLAARYETLGVVMRVVGNTAGHTGEEMEVLAKGVEKMGITVINSRLGLIRMLQAQLDVTKATELARVAQDAAVIANINSSEAFETLIHGIQSARVVILRNIGIMVSFEASYAKAAKAMDRTAESLTNTEKAQIRMNAVLEAGTDIAGSYEAAYDTVGKKLKSLVRPIEDIKVSLGAAFTPALSDIVEDIMTGLTNLKTILEENEEAIEGWGTTFRTTVIKIETEIISMIWGMTEAARIAKSTWSDVMKDMAESWEWLGIIERLQIEKEKGWRGKVTVGLADEGFFKKLSEEGVDYWENLEKDTKDRQEKYLKTLQALKDRLDTIVYENTPKYKALAKEMKDKAEELLLEHKERLKEEIEAEDRALEEKKRIAADEISLQEELLKGQEEWIIKSQELHEEQAAENRELDERVREYKIKNSKKLLEIDIGRLRMEMDQNTERYNMEFGLIDELETRLKQLATLERKEAELTKNQQKLLARDIQRMNSDTLKKHIEDLKIEQVKFKDNIDMYLHWQGKIDDAIEESHERRIRQLHDIAEAVESLGKFIGEFNDVLAKSAQHIADIIDSLGDLKVAKNIYQEITAYQDILTSIYKTIQPIMDSIFDTPLYSDLGDKLGVVTKELEKQKDLLNVTYGSERVKHQKNIIELLKEQAKIEEQITRSIRDRLEIFGQRRDKTEEEVNAEIEYAKQQLRELLTATTTTAIADSISDGFRQGLDSAEVFANTFEDMMRNAMTEAFKRDIMSRHLKNWYETFAIYAEEGLTPWELTDLRTRLETAFSDIESTWGSLSELAESVGIELAEAIDPTTPTGMAGAIRGITEKTAGLLAGQFNAMRIDMKGVRNAVEATNEQVYGTFNAEVITNRIEEISTNSYSLINIVGIAKLSLNALTEIRDYTYYNKGIFAQVEQNQLNTAGMLETMNDVLIINTRIADNTDRLENIEIHLRAMRAKSLISEQRALG